MLTASTCFQPATQTHPKRSTNASELCTSFFLKKSGNIFILTSELRTTGSLLTGPCRCTFTVGTIT